MNAALSAKVQLSARSSYKLIRAFLKTFSRTAHVPNELVDRIASFMFMSPFRFGPTYSLQAGFHLFEGRACSGKDDHRLRRRSSYIAEWKGEVVEF